MTGVEILAAFEREINKLDDTLNKPFTSDSLYWLNQAVSKFVKLRFNGNAPHLTSYEQNEKRTRDLVNLLKSKTYTVFTTNTKHTDYDSYTIVYPSDYMFALNEDVVITDTDGDHKMDTCVFECTADSFMYRINNSLTDFHYRHYKARPLRIRTVNGCSLLTDKKYKIAEYTLGYLRQPKEITLDKTAYSEFPEIILPEIIKMAAQMYIENQADKRYQTISNEVNTQE